MIEYKSLDETIQHGLMRLAILGFPKTKETKMRSCCVIRRDGDKKIVTQHKATLSIRTLLEAGIPVRTDIFDYCQGKLLDTIF
jgi:hypothetical protein